VKGQRLAKMLTKGNERALKIEDKSALEMTFVVLEDF
jgi:hypothetical protein